MLKVFCVHCKKHIYNYAGDTILNEQYIFAELFVPANEDIEQPQEGDDMECPFCGKYFMKNCRVLTDQGFLPK